MLQRDGVDVAHDHPAEGAAQVVDHAAVGLLGQQVGEDGEHHGIVPAHRPAEEKGRTDGRTDAGALARQKRIRHDDGSGRLGQAAQAEHAVVAHLRVVVFHPGHEDGEQAIGQPARYTPASGHIHQGFQNLTNDADGEGALGVRARGFLHNTTRGFMFMSS